MDVGTNFRPGIILKKNLISLRFKPGLLQIGIVLVLSHTNDGPHFFTFLPVRSSSFPCLYPCSPFSVLSLQGSVSIPPFSIEYLSTRHCTFETSKNNPRDVFGNERSSCQNK